MTRLIDDPQWQDTFAALDAALQSLDPQKARRARARLAAAMDAERQGDPATLTPDALEPLEPLPNPHPRVIERLRANNHPVGRPIDLATLSPAEQAVIHALRMAFLAENGGDDHPSFVRIAKALWIDAARVRAALRSLTERGLVYLATCEMECYGLCYAEQIQLVEGAGLARRWRHAASWVLRDKFDPQNGQVPLLQFVKSRASGEGPALPDAPVPSNDPAGKR